MLKMLLAAEPPADEARWQAMEIGRKIMGSSAQSLNEVSTRIKLPTSSVADPSFQRIIQDATSSLSSFNYLCPFIHKSSLTLSIDNKRALDYVRASSCCREMAPITNFNPHPPQS